MRTIYLHTDRCINQRKSKRIVKKIVRKNKDEKPAIALSNNLMDNEFLKYEFSQYGIKILNGRWLFKFLICDTLEYIINKESKRIEKQNIVFLLTDIDDVVIEQIIRIAKIAKNVKIVSDNLYKFEYIEKKLFDDFGIAIQITNNKRKGLLNSDIIINNDFNEQMLLLYDMDTDAIFVNIKYDYVINVANFYGTSIAGYKIDFDNEDIFEIEDSCFFDKNILYEGYIYRRDNFSNIYSQLKRDKVKITELEYK